AFPPVGTKVIAPPALAVQPSRSLSNELEITVADAPRAIAISATIIRIHRARPSAEDDGNIRECMMQTTPIPRVSNLLPVAASDVTVGTVGHRFIFLFRLG